MAFEETSAKACVNVEETVDRLMQRIVQRGLVEARGEGKGEPKGEKVTLADQDKCRKPANDSCC
jgi:hypothetical protein